MTILFPAFISLACSAIASPAWHDNKSHHGSESCSITYSGIASTESPATCSATRTTYYSSFSYTALTTIRYATAVPAPLVLTTTYGPPFSQATTLLPSGQTYTSYSLNRNATTIQDGQYGQGAYARLWTPIRYNTTVPFTTTVTPTPVASSELIYPPALYTACPQQVDACIDCYKLPKDFIWGVAGSAWQIEGGLTEDGRGPSQLDTIGALGTADAANAEVTDMNYYLYKQDIARLAAIGIPYYSFSIAWTRVVPFGIVGSPINKAGLDHYDDVINTCLEYGIQPIVTLTHADPPLNVSYEAPEFADSFLYYAKEVMTRYSDRVSHWVTLNEPNLVFSIGFASYSAVRNILQAHASVFHWYKEELMGTGLVTVKFANNLATPLDNASADDLRAALRYQDFLVGILGNPIFLGEQIPDEVLNTPGLNVTALTDEELAYYKGTSDFLSVDPYTAGFATSAPSGIDACANNQSDPLWPTCVFNTNVQADGWLNGQGSYAYAYIAPQYVRQQLGYLWNTFKPSGIMITEFGFNPFMESAKTTVAQLYDLERTIYYQAFLRETLKAIYEDHVNVIGTLAWSFLDNDEFGSYDQQYGVQHVNRTNGEFTRSYKRSFFDYVDFFHQYVEK